MTLVALLVTLCSTLLGHPTVRWVDHPAASFLGGDGTRTRLVDASRPGLVATEEWARDETIGILSSGPEAFGYWTNVAGVDPLSVGFARRTTTVTGDGAPSRTDILMTIETDGVRTTVVQGAGPALVFSPGVLTLVADVAPGRRWTSAGVARTFADGRLSAPSPYEADHVAAAAADPGFRDRGCLDVVESERVGGASPRRSVSTWCPGQGVVASDDGSSRLRTGIVSPTPPGEDDTDFDWSTAERLAWATLPVSHIGLSLVNQSPVAPPGVLPDGTLVFANRIDRDLVAVRAQRTAEPSLWRARPGGGITTAATLGTVTVAVTSERRVVAYGPDGQWLWTTPVTDIGRVPPQAFAGGVLVSTIDGVVQLLDRNDGTVRWRYRTPGELRLAPVVASGALIVADQSGQLARVDADGREVWSVGHTKPLQVAVAGDTVVVSPHAGSLVSAFRFDDGGPAWQLRPDSALTDILAIDGVLVSRSSDDVQGLDPSTGDVLWRRPLVALGIAGGGNRLLVVSDSGLTILEPATGRTLVERPHGLGALSRTSFFVSSGGGRLVVSTSGKAAVGSLP